MSMDDLKACLNRQEGNCVGLVSRRPSHAGTGTLITRCEGHHAKAEEKAQEIRERYPDSSIPPAWFDPTYAGESWDEE